MADKKVPNLKAKYQAEIAPALMQKFGYKSPMQIPRLDKIVVNCGCGEARDNSKEQLIFPEIEYDKIDKIRGLDVVICTTANTDEEAKELLTLVGAPFATAANK